MAIKVQSHVKAYEIGGSDQYHDMALAVRSHWNRSDMVVIQILDGKEITVIGSDLIAAVRNAMNKG